MSKNVSTGRGGAGNIGQDTTEYTDGDIIREGVAGESDRPQYSAGRGGAANISRGATPVTGGAAAGANGAGKTPSPPTVLDPNNKGKGKEPVRTASPAPSNSSMPAPNAPSQVVIPETATRSAEGYENFHTGRGGQGNVHKEKYGGHSKAQREKSPGPGLIEKVKGAVGLDKRHKESPLQNETGSS